MNDSMEAAPPRRSARDHAGAVIVAAFALPGILALPVLLRADRSGPMMDDPGAAIVYFLFAGVVNIVPFACLVAAGRRLRRGRDSGSRGYAGRSKGLLVAGIVMFAVSAVLHLELASEYFAPEPNPMAALGPPLAAIATAIGGVFGFGLGVAGILPGTGR